LFDAVAVVLSEDQAGVLARDGSAIDFVRDAFGHLKALALDAGGMQLFEAAGLNPDDGVFEAGDTGKFIAAAKTRRWDREKHVRTLA